MHRFTLIGLAIYPILALHQADLAFLDTGSGSGNGRDNVVNGFISSLSKQQVSSIFPSYCLCLQVEAAHSAVSTCLGACDKTCMIGALA